MFQSIIFLVGRYYNCVHGYPHIYDCPPPLIFDEAQVLTNQNTALRITQRTELTNHQDTTFSDCIDQSHCRVLASEKSKPPHLPGSARRLWSRKTLKVSSAPRVRQLVPTAFPWPIPPSPTQPPAGIDQSEASNISINQS